MTAEQQRTLAYYEERYQHHVAKRSRNQIKTAKDWHAFNDASRDYYGYRKWLDTYVLNRSAA